MEIKAKYRPEICTAKAEERPHLAHTYLDTKAGKLIAIDGIRMVVIPVIAGEGDVDGFVSAEAFKAGRKLAKKAKTSDVPIRANGALTVADGTTFARPPMADASGFPQFPAASWQRVLPTSEPINVRIAFSARCLLDIAQALGATDDQVEIEITGGVLDPILVKAAGSPHAAGVLMPCRFDV